MREWIDDFKNFIEWVKEQKISFVVYLGAFAIAFFGLFISAFTGIPYHVFSTLFSFLLIAGFVWDSIIFVSQNYNNLKGQALFLALSVFLYFTYIQAESFAFSAVVATTGEKAEYFQFAISYLKGVFLLPSLMLLIISNIVVLFFVVIVLSYISFFTLFLSQDHSKLFAHLTLYFLAVVVTTFTFFSTDAQKVYNDYLGKDFVPMKIIHYSYHPNTSCKNIEKGVYINFLDDDRVSVSNIKQISLDASDDQNITFESKKCVKQERVSKL